MPYDSKLAVRLQDLLGRRNGFEEKKMFGGVCFFLNGNICVGIHKDNLILRLGKEEGELALLREHIRPFDITGRPMTGWVMVRPPAFKTKSQLSKLVEWAIQFVETLPAK